MAKQAIPCRFCGAPAIAKFAMDRGCACYPDDREQDLCAQHIINAEPLGSMVLVHTHDARAYSWLRTDRRNKQ